MSTQGHILVAEDNPADAFFLQRAFSRAGIPVILHFVRDGEEAVHYLRGTGPFDDRAKYPLPHLLMLDLNMPHMDGFDVLEWIRAQPGLEHLVVVIFSGSEQPGSVTRAHNLGADWYLVKPHSIDGLMELVGRFKKYWIELEDDHPRKAA